MAEREERMVHAPDYTGLGQLRLIAHLWDELIRLPVIGRRIGLDAILGLVPGIGDAAAAVVASWAVIVGYRMGAPNSVLLRMAGNIAVDTLFGSIPLLGDLFDIGWRAQRRNVELLERWAATPQVVQRSSRMMLVGLAILALGTVIAACWGAIVAVRWILT